MRGILSSVLALGLLLLAGWPAPAASKDDINAAVDRGVKFVKTLQGPDGTWAGPQIGLTALAGLTLLECGVPADDDAIQKAAAVVRSEAVDADQTYSIALCILFLDRLGESVDVALIESLTVRLLAGQGDNNGWTYTCPKIAFDEQRRLSTMVKKRTNWAASRTSPKRSPANESCRTYRANPRPAGAGAKAACRGLIATPGSDNSNTQFAILGLWVARRHGLPVDGALAAVENASASRSARMGAGDTGPCRR